MELIQRIQSAIDRKDKSELPLLERAVEDTLRPLIASGQRNYAAIVNGLLDQLRAVVSVPKLSWDVKTNVTDLSGLISATGHPPITGFSEIVSQANHTR